MPRIAPIRVIQPTGYIPDPKAKALRETVAKIAELLERLPRRQLDFWDLLEE